MKHLSLVLLMGFIAAYALPASAVDFPNGFYASGSAGIAADQDSCDQIQDPKLRCEDENFGWKLGAGFQFMKWISLEAGYSYLGKADATARVNDQASSEVQGITATAVFTVPFLEKAGLYGKVGGIYWDAEILTTPRGQPTTKISDNGTDLLWGVGFRFPFTDKLGMVIEGERYQDVGSNKTGSTDINLYSMGLIWRF
jgi:OOP family OmpA-OmpF porin